MPFERRASVLRLPRFLLGFVGALLGIEFLDEFVFGAREAGWPGIRDDLGLSYVQVGLLIGLPGVTSALVEPFFGVLGSTRHRRTIILLGGWIFTASLFVTAVAPGFWVLMIAFIALYPASGAFVSLSQASLMDSDPARHDHLMARWTFAGSLGVVAGPLVLGAFVLAGFGWRECFIAMGVVALGFLLLARRHSFGGAHEDDGTDVRKAVHDAIAAFHRWAPWRWLLLLLFSDLMLDTMLGFLALYLVDASGATGSQAALGVAVWAVAGLAGDGLLIPALERVPSLRYLRVSSGIILVLYPLLLVSPWFWLQVAILAVIGFFNAGWYAIPQGRLYSTLPGQSGTVVTISAVFSLVSYAVPISLGLAAEQFGIEKMMWVLLLGPVALLVGLPRGGPVVLMGEESEGD